MRKWARRHKRATHPRPASIRPGLGEIGSLGEGKTQKYHKKKKSGILNTFKGSVPVVGAMIRTKDKNFKESLQNFQESVLQYVMANYKEGVDIATLIRKLEDVDISSEESVEPTGSWKNCPTEISKKRYELELKNTCKGKISWKII